MKIRTIVITAAVFGVVGPALGAMVTWAQRPPTTFGTVVVLSYIFGGIPALIAGIAYGGLRARSKGSLSHWYSRALGGAAAGLFGCLGFFVLVAGYDLLTVGRTDTRFLVRLIVAGIPAGMICALLVGAVTAIASRTPATGYETPG